MPNTSDKLELAEVSSLQTMSKIVSDSPSFQVIVKTVKGFLITIDDLTPENTIRSVMQKIEEKDRIPYEQTGLFYQSQLLELDQTLQDYEITSGANLETLLGIKGGLGELQTMKYVNSQELNRGNVKVEIVATGGESKALKDWGRGLSNNPEFWRLVRDRVNANRTQPLSAAKMNEWISLNYKHITGLIQETTQSGNCGDFAAITHSHLVRTTTNQFVYMLTMHSPRPKQNDPGWLTATDAEKIEWFEADAIQKIVINNTRLKLRKQLKKELESELSKELTDQFNEELVDQLRNKLVNYYLPLKPEEYDHQLCMTYHKYVSNLSDVDLQRAMIADGWDSNKVTTLERFMNFFNAYKDAVPTSSLGLSFPNLKLSQGQFANGEGGLESEGLKAPIKDIIEQSLNQYKRSPHFEEAKAAALKVTTHLFDMDPRNDVSDGMEAINIQEKLDKIPIDTELDIFIRECLDLSPEKTLEYFSRIDGTPKGNIMILTPQIANHFLTDLPFSALEHALSNPRLVSTESFIKYIQTYDVIATLTRSNLLCQRIGHILANTDISNFMDICNRLFSNNVDGLVFSTIREADDIVNITTTLWQRGQEAQGDFCLNSVAHLPTFEQVLAVISTTDLKDYINRQNIWTNKAMFNGYRRGNKPTIHAIARHLSTAQLKEFRTTIGLEKWSNYVDKALTAAQKAAL